MKKTSLLLAISALLYGTSSVYALPDIKPDMSEADLVAILSQIVDIPPVTGIAEDALDVPPLPGDPVPPLGLDEPQPLPGNVSVINEDPVKLPTMCTVPAQSSFQVKNGAAMASFPVTVTVGGVDEKINTWSNPVVLPDGKQVVAVVGTGWILVPPLGDTWNTSWLLYTTVTITKILLEPLERNTSNDPAGQKRVYTFDVGGKRPTAPDPVGPHEHTPGSARGQFIKQTSPTAPSPIFTATYSDPVDIATSGGNHVLGDYTPIPFTESYGGPKTQPPSRIPTHDLYGTLQIDFITPPLVQQTLIVDPPAFAFVADTDCILPVVGASFSSNLLTLFGEGLVYVKETNSSGGYSLMPTPFEVEKDGVNTFDVGGLISNLQANHCYSLVNEGSLNKNIPLEVNGKDLPGDKYCK